MRDDILEYDLKLSDYCSSIYKVYFPAEMATVEHDKNREMLTKWALVVAKDIELTGYGDINPKDRGLAKEMIAKKPPDMLLWLANYVGNNEEPKWQVVISSSPEGVKPREVVEGYFESLFTLIAKRDYFVEGGASRRFGVLSMYLVMPGKLVRRTETVVNPVMYSILSVAMSRYAEIATEYARVCYRDGLRFKAPYACHSGEIIFSIG